MEKANLVQKLVWRAFGKNGKHQSLFRITEERDYADASDKAVTLAKANSVGLVHPLEMNDKEKAAWGEIFSDYEIISPFPQLGRPVYELEAAEKKATELKRFHDTRMNWPNWPRSLLINHDPTAGTYRRQRFCVSY